jgi:hypothetical protein
MPQDSTHWFVKWVVHRTRREAFDRILTHSISEYQPDNIIIDLSSSIQAGPELIVTTLTTLEPRD